MLRSLTSYGVDAAGGRAVAVAFRAGRFETVLDTARGAGDVAALRAQLARDVESGRARVAAAIGAHESVLRRLVVPLAAEDKARRVLPSLLDVELPFPLESCAYAFPLLSPRADGQIDALAVAVRRPEWTAALARAAESATEPTHLDHEALALWDQALAECPETAKGVQGVLHLAADHLTCVIGRDGVLLAAPALRHAGEAPGPLFARLAPMLRAVLEDAAAAPFPLLLTGAGAELREAVSALRAVRGDGARAAREPAAFLARALARRAAAPGRWPCPLRDGADEHPAVRRRRERGVARAQYTAMAAGLALLAISAGTRAWLHARTGAAQQALNRAAMELTGLSRVPRGQEVELVRRAMAEQGKRADPFVAAVQGSALDLVTRLSAAAREAGATIDRLRVEGPVFELAGRAQDRAAGDRLVARLAAQGWNSELVRTEAPAGEAQPFTVKGAR